MFSTILTLTMAAAIGQAPPDGADYLEMVPDDVPVVLRVRGLDPVPDDLKTMIRAMSPAAAEAIGPQVDEAVDDLAGDFGEVARSSPALFLLELPEPGEGQAVDNPPPFAVLFRTDDYQQALRAITDRDDVAPRTKPGGYDYVTTEGGTTLFVARKEGLVAVGESEELIAAIAAGPDETLGRVIPDDLVALLFEGDLGAYVNLAAVTDRYGEQIDQARQAMMQAFEQMGNAGMTGALRDLYGRLFDFVGETAGLAVGVDFAERGLDVSAKLTLKEGSDLLGTLGEVEPMATDALGGLPADSAYYFAMAADTEAIAGSAFGELWMQQMTLAFGMLGDEPPPELEEAMERLRRIGRIETVGSFAIGDGLELLYATEVDEPGALIDAYKQFARSLEGGEAAMIKDLEIEPGAETFEGTRFDRWSMTIDFAGIMGQVAEQVPGEEAPDPAAAEMMDRMFRGMFGGDALQVWTGEREGRLFTVSAPSWERARGLLSAYLDGDGGIGSVDGYRRVRSRLPDEAHILYLLSAQGFVRQMAWQLNAMFGQQQLEVPAGMPEEPALLGFSVVVEPDGLRLRGVVPSEVGPVIEKGYLPMFQQLGGAAGAQAGGEEVKELEAGGRAAP